MSEIPNSKFTLGELVPDDWNFPGSCSVMLTVYRVYLVPDEQILSFPTLVLPDVRLFAFRGKLPPWPRFEGGLEPWVGGQPQMRWELRTPSTDEMPVGTFLFVLARLAREADSDAQQTARGLIADAVTTLHLISGRNAALSREINEIVFRQNGIQHPSGAAESPVYHGPADLSLDRLTELSELWQAIERMPMIDSRRCKLSLRWASRGGEANGVDSLLAWWIAIETLAMPDTTNVRAINRRLASAHTITLEEAVVRFKVGRLQNLRAMIVHDGRLEQTTHNLERYIEALYIDLLRDVCGMPMRSLASLMSEPDFDLEVVLKSS